MTWWWGQVAINQSLVGTIHTVSRMIHFSLRKHDGAPVLPCWYSLEPSHHALSMNKLSQSYVISKKTPFWCWKSVLSWAMWTIRLSVVNLNDLDLRFNLRLGAISVCRHWRHLSHLTILKSNLTLFLISSMQVYDSIFFYKRFINRLLWKQCSIWSAGFFRSQLIWIYTVFKRY